MKIHFSKFCRASAWQPQGHTLFMIALTSVTIKFIHFSLVSYYLFWVSQLVLLAFFQTGRIDYEIAIWCMAGCVYAIALLVSAWSYIPTRKHVLREMKSFKDGVDETTPPRLLLVLPLYSFIACMAFGFDAYTSLALSALFLLLVICLLQKIKTSRSSN